jgi:glycosyltransferase involved in cell wall biosynthesis
MTDIATIAVPPELFCENKKPVQWPWNVMTDPQVYKEREDWPMISMVVPSFNHGHFIEETIRSLVLQNYPKLEIIIMDGGSSDNTVEIIRKYETHIKHWVSEKDKGQTHAINKGIVHCSGQIFNWINSDDFLNPMGLYHVAKGFLENPDAQVLCGHTNILDLDVFVRLRPPSKHTTPLHDCIAVANINQEGTYFRMDVIRQLSPLEERFRFCMDLDLWIRYLLNFGQDRIASSEAAFTNFRRHPDAKSSSFLQTAMFDSTFVKERAAIMKSIAMIARKKEYVAVLADIAAPNLADYALSMLKTADSSFLSKVVAHYLYDLGKKSHYAGLLQISDTLLSAIQADDLDTELVKDRKYLLRANKLAKLKRVFSGKKSE